jgi:3-hydroxyisobutyrate dehydrogenase
MKVGWIGTGLMGLPMAQRLLDNDISLVAYNRSSSKLEPLRSAGVTIAASPHEVVSASECVILMLTDAQAIRSVLFSAASQKALPGRIVIQMGTIAPSTSKTIRDEVVAAGGNYLEAPVLGSIPEAKAGKLIVMVGASPEQFQQWVSLLQHFGPDPLLIGPVGTAAAAKLALNQLIAALTTAFALSLSFAMRYGVDTDLWMDIVRNSALYAPTFDKKLARMLNRDYANPNFPIKHLIKDTNLFIAEAASVGLNVSSLEGVRKILDIAMNLNFSEEDYSSLFSVVNPQD